MNVALIGCTHPHSRAHLNTLRLCPEVERIWLWDRDRAAAEQLAEHAGETFAGATDDLAAVLTPEAAGMIVLCVRNDEAPEFLARAAQAGQHIFAEKPLATHSRHLTPALDAARAARVAVGVCYQWRGHPVSQHLRELIGQGLLGPLMAVEGRMVTSQVRLRNPQHWLFDREKAGGGILSWLGCHFLDLLRYLLQDEVAEVMAMLGTLNGEPITVEDTAMVTLRWRSGALGTFHAGYHLPRSTPGYMGPAYDTHLAAKGRLGNFMWQPTRAEHVLHVESVAPAWVGAPEREFQFEVEKNDAYGGRPGLEFFRQFLHAAETGERPLASGDDALALLRLLEAIYESHETGRRVQVRTA